MYKTILNNEEVWVYSPEEHTKAVEYENMSHKLVGVINRLMEGGK